MLCPKYIIDVYQEGLMLLYQSMLKAKRMSNCYSLTLFAIPLNINEIYS